ncbi:outer membrane protein assembly factor BamD [Pontibacter aquaedesilientis]|uniref:outer membrane protein assembly factor BamD n=1 Tax=Pontibacter aquaedesilientis TaxID=2766980 RepID=UPI001CD062FF|nr:outer membrane protein assembly factor BamD [Pontibacter aquaedesilientis]
MNRGIFHTVVLLCLLVFATSCSNFQKLLKSNDVDKKYKAALEYYEKGDYYRANQLLEQVMPLMTGREEAEQARFYYANTHYQQREYMLSAFQFRTFYETYPRSEKAEEAMFLQAKSLYNDSPDFEQDQTSTITAMESIQEFLVRYPNSEYAAEANTMFETLSAKLDQKAFESARLYYKLHYYKSAVVAFTNFLRENPSSPYSEQASYLRIDAQYRFALESVPDKQQERFMEAVDFYQSFIDQYPDSRFLRSAEQVYSSTQSELEKLKKNNPSNS